MQMAPVLHRVLAAAHLLERNAPEAWALRRLRSLKLSSVCCLLLRGRVVRHDRTGAICTLRRRAAACARATRARPAPRCAGLAARAVRHKPCLRAARRCPPLLTWRTPTLATRGSRHGVLLACADLRTQAARKRRARRREWVVGIVGCAARRRLIAENTAECAKRIERVARRSESAARRWRSGGDRVEPAAYRAAVADDGRERPDGRIAAIAAVAEVGGRLWAARAARGTRRQRRRC